MRARLSALALGFVLAGPLTGQPALLRNARLDSRPLSPGGLAAAVGRLQAKGDPTWIAWEIPPVGKADHRCCYGSLRSARSEDLCCGGCHLEDDRAFVASSRTSVRKLEGEARLTLFLRVEKGQVGRVRVFSPDCAIDAGGLPVVWLSPVSPDEGVALLHDLVERSAGRDEDDDVREHALMAIGAHAGAAADQSLIALARRDPVAEVRSRALFWLAQRAGEKAVRAIGDALEDDPDTDVKVQAVFALTQLPSQEGTPHLIRLTRTHRNPEVRRQAVFWLGQSKDPRALTFLEKLLLSP